MIFRCPTYQNIPSECTLKPDPQDNCCKIISCGALSAITTPPPLFAQTSPPTGTGWFVLNLLYQWEIAYRFPNLNEANLKVMDVSVTHESVYK